MTKEPAMSTDVKVLYSNARTATLFQLRQESDTSRFKVGQPHFIANSRSKSNLDAAGTISHFQ